jgi:uncharacterized protein (TIGR03790 family)
LFLAVGKLHADGSGLNVVVVVNQNSTNSVQLGNYYCELRNVPPQNLLRINWTGGNIEWTTADYSNALYNPLIAMVSSRGLTNQVFYVVLSMDIPYRINGDSQNDGDLNSTTSALFYGFKSDPHDLSMCEIATNTTDTYTGSESIFRNTLPSSNTLAFLATMITADDLPTAEMVVRQGVASDGTFPAQTVWLGKSSDTARNVRYSEFDNTIFNTRLRGNYSVARTNMFNAFFGGLILGYQNGTYAFGISPIPLFVPGTMADSLTSFGGQIFENTGQTTLLAFAAAGASGSYGTVNEPCGYQEKFPDSQNYFYQARGFSLGECYYQSVTNIYEGLVYGEPLAAPFAKKGTGTWPGISSNSVLSGTTNLSVQFTASDYRHPLQQLDLFVDGLFLTTISNIPPQSRATLQVTINGSSATYTVPANATINSVTAGLVNTLNSNPFQLNTKISAFQHGDRIELQSTAPYTRTGSQISIATDTEIAGAPLTTFLQFNDLSSFFLDTVAQGFKQCVVGGTLLANSTTQLTVTKTNGTTVSITVTNSGGATVTDFAQEIVNAINSTTALQGPDGVYAADAVQATETQAILNIYAQSEGYAAAQIKVAFSGLSTVTVTPLTASTLTDNVHDLQPREHLYVTVGVTNLSATIPLATANLSDGYHELEAVAYEGSSVHTQTRATQNVIVKNTSLTATFNGALTGTNTSTQPTLQFTVTPNTVAIHTIQLFSTGGLLAAVTNQSSATFAVNLASLDVGLHPFYAIVTDNTGHQYRTQTQNVRFISVANNGANLIGVDYPFTLTFNPSPLTLFWPATAGRSYFIQSTTNLDTTPFQTRAMFVPASSAAQWTATDASPAQQFYRISVTP